MGQQFLVTEKITVSRANDVKSKHSEFTSSSAPESFLPRQRLQCGERILWSGHLCREDSSSEGGVITILWASCQTFEKITSNLVGVALRYDLHKHFYPAPPPLF